MKMIIGYIPAAIVVIPFVVAWVRQSLYYKGCMDGYQYVFTAMFAFLVGGILNLAFLTYVTLTKKAMPPSGGIVTKGNVGVALVTMVFQLVVLAYVFIPKFLNK